MVGACLIAAFLVSAVAAGSALAKKSEYNVHTYGQFKSCPYTNTEVTDCFVGITSGGASGGSFQFGHVTVKLNKSITLQGGYKGFGSNIEVVPATNGGETLESPELKVTGGLGLITKLDQEASEWPQALKESFKEAKKNKEAGLNVKIELAGNELFEVPGGLNTENLLFEEGTAFRLPLKVRLINPWLEKLGGGPCLIGSDANPVMQHLTTGDAGRAGDFLANDNFTNLEFAKSKLVDVDWPIEPASKASGCGGEYESFVNDAINRVLEIHPWKSGITVLQGTLWTGSRKAVRSGIEFGNEDHIDEVE
jgi:hypothetical protein